MNAYVNCLFKRYLHDILKSSHVAIPDDPEEMNWRVFFAHSQDMQGFRADIFTGGPNEGDCKRFTGLRERWHGDSRSLISDLGSLWDDQHIRCELIRISYPFRPKEERAKGIQPALELLRNRGVHGAQVFADALDEFTGYRIARKTNGMIRAYIQNSHLLKQHNSSYRSYIQSIVAGESFPPNNILQAENPWVESIERDFYNVGPALASYMICDWLLWLWLKEKIDWFESYKADEVHIKALKTALKDGRLPEAASDFVSYCKTIRIPDGYGVISGKPCPPRVLNECIWLANNRSSVHS